MNRSSGDSDSPRDSATVLEEIFVGRGGELAELTNGLETILTGAGRFFLIQGEPGIGKTRLAREVAIRAADRGANVLWGRCHEDIGVPAYWPWIQITREYLASHDPEICRAALGTAAGDVAEIVPEVKEVVPDVQTAAVLQPEEARFRLFDSFSTFLRRASRRNPLLLILDNLHCADRSSLRLLEILAQDLDAHALMIVGTCVDLTPHGQHPLAETRGELLGYPHFQEIYLRALSEEAMVRMVGHALGDRVSTDLGRTLHQRTDGNPLFALEVMRLLLREPRLIEDGGTDDFWRARIPEQIGLVVRRRLRLLSSQCKEMLSHAAIMGPEFAQQALEALLEESHPGMVLEMLEEAMTASLIEEVSSDRGVYRFTHLLMQEAIASQLSTSTKASLHRAIAAALESRYAQDPAGRAVELARHFAGSGTDEGREKAVHYLIVAGEQALSVYAHDEAATLFRQALELREDQPVDSQIALISEGLSRALFLIGEDRHAVQNLVRAFEYHEGTGDTERAVSAVELPYRPSFGFTWSAEGATVNELRVRALRMVEANSAHEGRVLSVLGRFHYHESGYQAARNTFQRALDIARRENNQTIQARVLVGWAQIELAEFHLLDIEKRNRLGIECARSAGDNYTERRLLHQSGFTLLALGDPHGAQAQVEAMRKFEETHRAISFHSQRFHLQQAISQLTGNWDKTRATIRDARDSNWFDIFTAHNLAILEHEVGHTAERDRWLARIASEMKKQGPFDATILCTIGCITLARLPENEDQPTLAETVARAILASPHGTPFMSFQARASLVLIALKRRDTNLLAEFDLSTESNPIHWIMPWGHLSTDRLRGLSAQGLGRIDDAERHYLQALQFCDQGGFRPELAWTASDLAALLLSRGDSESLKRAASLLDRAIAIARELGMATLSGVLDLRQRQVRDRSSPSEGSLLTKRELEVLRLVAKGMTNQEIAYALFISEYTVGNHVSSILSRTRTTNRTEAALFAAHKGLLEDR